MSGPFKKKKKKKKKKTSSNLEPIAGEFDFFERYDL